MQHVQLTVTYLLSYSALPTMDHSSCRKPSASAQYALVFLLQVSGLLLEHPTWRSLLESQPAHARELIGSLLQVFDSRLWHPASGVLLK